MKLKWYLRGLGIGIVAASIIMGAVNSYGKSDLSDEEVKQKAAELGMVESSSFLASKADENVSAQSASLNSSDEESFDASVSSTSLETDSSLGGSEQIVNTDTLEEKSAQNSSDAESSKDSANVSSVVASVQSSNVNETASEDEDASISVNGITIASGSGSDTVSRSLEGAGFIDSAATFNQYLIDRGLDTRIKAGYKSIPAGSSYEEIASIITK